MLREIPKQQSFLNFLYDRIPSNHLLKKIETAVDFSFVNTLLADSYCKDNGRPAKEPEMMLKLLFLEYLYNLSDVKVIEEAGCNLAFLWFLGLNPEDSLPDASLLTKFRKCRLKDFSLDEILTEIVRQCVENGLVKGSGISIDTTHIEAAVIRKVPERILKHLARRIFKAMSKDNGGVGKDINTKIPDYTKIEDPTEARKVMKEYLEQTITACEPRAGEHTKFAIAEAREVLADEKFLVQKGIRSLVDKDARVGHKSKDSSFYGYKMEYMMTTDERIITAVETQSGEYVDGQKFNELIDKTLKSEVKVEEVYGDKAYFRGPILEKIEQENATPYIPTSASAYRIDEELFSYNKDSDQWFCFMGNETTAKKKTHTVRKGKDRDYLKYTFNKAMCESCQHRDRCMGKTQTKARVLQVSLTSAMLYEHSMRQKTSEFLEKYKKRAAQEGKNAEMKRFHGLTQARGYGLNCVATQAKLTAIAVNLKRIAALITIKDNGKGNKNSRLFDISNFKTYLPKFASFKLYYRRFS